MKVHAFRNAGLNQTSRHFPCYRAVSHLLSLLWDWDGQQASGACRGGGGATAGPPPGRAIAYAWRSCYNQKMHRGRYPCPCVPALAGAATHGKGFLMEKSVKVRGVKLPVR